MLAKFVMHVSVRPSQHDGLFVSHCTELDIYSQGRTREEASASVLDAVGMYLRHGLNNGTLLDILERLGVQAADSEDEEVEVPIDLLAFAHKRGQIGGSPDSWRR